MLSLYLHDLTFSISPPFAKNNPSSLHVAADQGHREVVALLLEKGADMKQATIDGLTAFSFATQNGHREVVALLLDNGADVKAVGKDGRTPLHLAARYGHREVVELLLERGAQVNQESPHWGTPLFVAAYRGPRDVVELLLKHGADKTIKVSRGEAAGLRPVDIARKEGHTALIPLLEP